MLLNALEGTGQGHAGIEKPWFKASDLLFAFYMNREMVILISLDSC